MSVFFVNIGLVAVGAEQDVRHPVWKSAHLLTDELQIDDLEIFENVAYIMAYHADPSIPKTIEEWLDQFEMLYIYQVLPQILELRAFEKGRKRCLVKPICGIELMISSLSGDILTGVYIPI